MQFIWWVGVVEDRQDPKKAGRCRVRIIGAHTENKSDLPTDKLPWAQPILSPNDSSSIQLKEGDFVVGFYFDGTDAQVPVIMGVLPGVPTELRPASQGFSDPRTASELNSAPKPPASVSVANGPVKITEGNGQRNPHPLNESTISRIARNESTSTTAIQFKKNTRTSGVPTAGGGTWSEPATPYNAKYPYNRVMETESGHVLEFDDSPGAERVHLYHRSGSFIEIHPDGKMVMRAHAASYEVVLDDKNVCVHGDLNFTTTGDITFKAGGKVKIESSTEIGISAGTQLTTSGTIVSHIASGPMNVTGIPLNLNGPGVVPVIPPTPVVVVTAGVL